jgi:hypothetical protein
MTDQAFRQLFGILKNTAEWQRNHKAIQWFNDNIGRLPQEEIDAKMKIFEDKIDPMVNDKWRAIRKLYQVEDKNAEQVLRKFDEKTSADAAGVVHNQVQAAADIRADKDPRRKLPGKRAARPIDNDRHKDKKDPPMARGKKKLAGRTG